MPVKRLAELFGEPEEQAINHRILSCTVPLIAQSQGRAGVGGTGTLFEIEERHFIVSARHVLADCEPNTLGVPTTMDRTSGTIETLSGCVRYLTRDESLDVAVLEITRADLVRGLINVGYSFLGPASIGSFGERFAQYVVAGFPNELATQSPDGITPQFVKITAVPYSQQPPSDFNAAHEFLLSYGEAAPAPNGAIVRTTELRGMSGAAVWGVCDPSQAADGLWSVDDAIKVVGVQHAYNHSRYVRCHSWWLVARAFEAIDAELARAVARALPPPR